MKLNKIIATLSILTLSLTACGPKATIEPTVSATTPDDPAPIVADVDVDIDEPIVEDITVDTPIPAELMTLIVVDDNTDKTILSCSEPEAYERDRKNPEKVRVDFDNVRKFDTYITQTAPVLYSDLNDEVVVSGCFRLYYGDTHFDELKNIALSASEGNQILATIKLIPTNAADTIEIISYKEVPVPTEDVYVN